jgi:hypothetical protein
VRGTRRCFLSRSHKRTASSQYVHRASIYNPSVGQHRRGDNDGLTSPVRPLRSPRPRTRPTSRQLGRSVGSTHEQTPRRLLPIPSPSHLLTSSIYGEKTQAVAAHYRVRYTTGWVVRIRRLHRRHFGADRLVLCKAPSSVRLTCMRKILTEYTRFEHKVVKDRRVLILVHVNQFDQQRANRAELRLSVVRHLHRTFSSKHPSRVGKNKCGPRQ